MRSGSASCGNTGGSGNMTSTHVELSKLHGTDFMFQPHNHVDINKSYGAQLKERSVARLKNQIQNLLIASLRPYIAAELPGWAVLYRVAVGTQSRDTLWSNAEPRFSHNKFHPFAMRYHLSIWTDREAYFLRRWRDLATQVFMRDVIRQGDTVVDIGAARGMFTLFAAYLTGATGKVIAYEPNPVLRGILERDLLGNRIRHVSVSNKAAGAAVEKRTLVVPRYDAPSASFGAVQASDSLNYKFEADVEPADTFLAFENPVLIKIATEGFETETLRGLTETISRCHPVLVTDLSDSRLLACGSSASEFVKQLADLGYLGFKIALSENSETADWSIRPLSPKDREIKAIWVHANSPADARGLILDRLIAG
jgi:FkbM family methyltransferase